MSWVLLFVVNVTNSGKIDMWYFTSSAINSPLIGMWHWIGTHLFWRFSPVRDNVIIYPHHSVELILELTIIIHNFIWTVPGLSRKQTIRPTTGFFVLDRLYPIDISHCRILNLSTYILSWPSRSIKKIFMVADRLYPADRLYRADRVILHRPLIYYPMDDWNHSWIALSSVVIAVNCLLVFPSVKLVWPSLLSYVAVNIHADRLKCFYI